MRILRGVGSRVLSCGCLVGLYETYSGPIVAILDARKAACRDPGHRVGAKMKMDGLDVVDAPARDPEP